MSRYKEIASDLRTRIQRGEFTVGARLPGISALQRHYGGVSLGTIRAAQQYLVEDGMLDTQQGRGAFVLAVDSRRELDVAAAVAQARDALGVVLEALSASTAGTVPFDLRDGDTYFVLTTALGDFAERQRSRPEDNAYEDGPPEASRAAWAEIAVALRDQIEAAFSSSHQPSSTTLNDAQRSVSA